MRLTKEDLDTIRQNYGFKNLSSLRKAELAPELATKIPPAFEDALCMLDQNNYGLSSSEIDVIIMHLIFMFNSSMNLQEQLKYLGGRLEIQSFEFVQELMAKVVDLHNNTRQWALKGYTPAELAKKNREHLRPLAKDPFRLESSDPDATNIIDFKTRTKIGRNDPCPCGSGKKLKKCCGK